MVPQLLTLVGVGLIGYKFWRDTKPEAPPPAPVPAPIAPPASSKFKPGDLVLAVKGTPPSQDNVVPLRLVRLDPGGWVGEALDTPGRVQTVPESQLLGPVKTEEELFGLFAKTVGLPPDFGFHISF